MSRHMNAIVCLGGSVCSFFSIGERIQRDLYMHNHPKVTVVIYVQFVWTSIACRFVCVRERQRNFLSVKSCKWIRLECGDFLGSSRHGTYTDWEVNDSLFAVFMYWTLVIERLLAFVHRLKKAAILTVCSACSICTTFSRSFWIYNIKKYETWKITKQQFFRAHFVIFSCVTLAYLNTNCHIPNSSSQYITDISGI